MNRSPSLANTNSLIAHLACALFSACELASKKDIATGKAKRIAAVKTKLMKTKTPFGQLVTVEDHGGELMFKPGVKARFKIDKDEFENTIHVENPYAPRGPRRWGSLMSFRQHKRWTGGLKRLEALKLQILVNNNPEAVAKAVAEFQKHYNC